MTLKTSSDHEIDWSALPGRSVGFTISRDGEEHVRAKFPANMVSVFVSDALIAAAESFEEVRKSGGEPSLFEAELPAIPIERIALAPSNIDGFKTLVLEIGEAQIGFAVPDEALSQFGNLLLSIGNESE